MSMNRRHLHCIDALDEPLFGCVGSLTPAARVSMIETMRVEDSLTFTVQCMKLTTCPIVSKLFSGL